MPEDRASRDGLLYLKEEELRTVLRTVPISDVYCVEDTVFARGKFATVRRALHKTTGVQYAAKYIKKRRRNVNMVPEIHHEISVLLKCGTNNRVVRLYEVYETNLDMVLILGLAAGGELQRIFDGDQCLGEVEARRAMRQILDGLCFLHERNIAHLDLKPQNILLMEEDSCDDIKLCDFGISRLLEPGTEVRTLSGTPDYVAPEVVSYEPISLATDIWSVGVLAYVLLSGYTPFGADTKEQTSLNISKGIVTFESEDFEDVSSAALDFMKSILVLNPKQRPTVQQLLQHPWINPPSHILPGLMPGSDAINVTPKSTPINQRKSLPCPPEIPQPANNTRTAFNTENLNDGEIAEENIKQYPIETEVLENGNSSVEKDQNNSSIFDHPQQNGVSSPHNESHSGSEEANSTPQEIVYFSQHLVERVLSNEVLSESSNEEVEENFCLLQNIEKPIHYTDVSFNISTNPPPDSPKEKSHELQNGIGECSTTTEYGFIRGIEELAEHQDNDIRRLREWILNGVPNTTVPKDQDEKDGEAQDTNTKELIDTPPEDGGVDSQINESITEEINAITIDSNDLQASNCQKESTEIFINTYEVEKQIMFTLNYTEISENIETSTVTETVLKSCEINENFLHDNYAGSIESNDAQCEDADNEDTKSIQEKSNVFVNTRDK